MVWFSPKTLRNQHQFFRDRLGMRVVDSLDHYLGLTLLVGKQNMGAFKHILDHFSKRINSWSKRLFSLGGKRIFIKSILQSLPTYACSVFLASRETLDEIISKTRNGGGQAMNKAGVGPWLLGKIYAFRKG